MFREITGSMEERLELIKNSMSKEIALKELVKCKSLKDFYWYSKKIRNGVMAQMEVYVLENYSKIPIEVWNNNSFKITPHTGKEELRFGKKDKLVCNWKIESFAKMEKEMWEKAIKIEQINFVLDEHDGDFSVTFNKGPWAFITGDTILNYYYVVKNYLDEKI